jgi:hypothetical protein
LIEPVDLHRSGFIFNGRLDSGSTTTPSAWADRVDGCFNRDKFVCACPIAEQCFSFLDSHAPVVFFISHGQVLDQVGYGVDTEIVQ